MYTHLSQQMYTIQQSFIEILVHVPAIDGNTDVKSTIDIDILGFRYHRPLICIYASMGISIKMSIFH